VSSVNIPITGNATSLVAATNQANAALSTMGNTAAAAGAKMTPAFGDASSAADKALKSLGPLGGVLSRISPQAGAAASAIAGLTSATEGMASAVTAAGGGMEVLEAAMGPAGVAFAAIGVVVGLATTAYNNYSESVKEAKHQQELLTDASKDQQELESRLLDAQMHLKEVTGTLTLAEQQRMQLKKVDIDLAAKQYKLTDEMGQLDVQIAEASTTADKELLRQKKASLQARLDSETKVAQELKATLSTELEYADAKKQSDEDIARRDKAKAQADKEAADAARKKAADEAKAAQAEQERLRKLNEIAAAEASLARITRAAQTANLEGLDRENEAYRVKLEAIRDAYNAAIKAGDSEAVAAKKAADAVLAVTAEHEQNVTIIMEQEAEKRQQVADSLAKADAEAKQQQLDDASTIAGASIGLAKSVADATAKTYDTTTESGRKAAEAQFKAQKAFAIATVIAEGAVAITKAVGSAPPPANIPAIAATSIAVGAELVTAASAQPKFHMGTTNYRPDEGSAVLQRGEGIVTSAGMNKPGMREAVAAANSGRAPFAADRAQPVQYQHRVFNEFIRDNLKQGSPVTRRIDSSAIVGHRVRR
jgi:hypothetical protein